MARDAVPKRTTRQTTRRQQITTEQHQHQKQQQPPQSEPGFDKLCDQRLKAENGAKQMEPVSAIDIPISDEKKKEIIHNDIQEMLENDLNCAICRETYINPLILNCSHSFCKFCVYHWLNRKPGCPTCRMTVTFQAENLALRNIINRMIQKSSQQNQTIRANAVSQRLKDEEQQQKDGVIPRILKPYGLDGHRISRRGGHYSLRGVVPNQNNSSDIYVGDHFNYSNAGNDLYIQHLFAHNSSDDDDDFEDDDENPDDDEQDMDEDEYQDDDSLEDDPSLDESADNDDGDEEEEDDDDDEEHESDENGDRDVVDIMSLTDSESDLSYVPDLSFDNNDSLDTFYLESDDDSVPMGRFSTSSESSDSSSSSSSSSARSTPIHISSSDSSSSSSSADDDDISILVARSRHNHDSSPMDTSSDEEEDDVDADDDDDDDGPIVTRRDRQQNWMWEDFRRFNEDDEQDEAESSMSSLDSDDMSDSDR